jgi:coniferyl-aldehyde dehydrogenase
MTTIAELKALLDRQKAAFAANPNPSLKQREERLDAITGAVVSGRERIQDALREDFSAHPSAQADFVEIFGVAGRLQFAKSMLEEWSKSDPRDLDPAMYGASRAYVTPQPKGVIGNMVPWNFPFDIGIGPLAEMLAGGNSVIIKPSDMTPACSTVMKEILLAAIDEDIVAVVPGDIELAKAFPTLPWDHLMYTGNPDVARSVAMAAAQNLVPLTLELGGKCPALFTESSVTRADVSSVLRTKMIKNGQMCVAPDYVLAPRANIDAFVAHARAFVAEAAPDYADSDDVTGIIADRHIARIEGLLESAASAGTEIVTLGEDSQTNGRRMPLRLVIDPSLESDLMREEIFGPVLPIVPYDTLDEAVGYIARNERPLGVYAFTHDEALKTRLLSDTHSGGVTFNGCAFQAAQPNIGFGGSGLSGYGRHHGIEGFREFTNPRGVVDLDPESLAQNIAPPYGDVADALLSAITGEDQ